MNNLSKHLKVYIRWLNYEIVLVLVLSANCPECTHCSWNTEKEDKALPWAT